MADHNLEAFGNWSCCVDLVSLGSVFTWC